MLVDKLSPPVFQRLVEAIAQEGHPTKANHLLRYLRRSFRWGVNHGACKTNPCAGVQQVKEAKQVHVPTRDLYTRVLNFAIERGARTARTAGSCPPYLAWIMELAYLCRLRGIEVLTLTDANITDQGIITNRRKGSRDTLVQWSPRLRAIVTAAQKHRKETRDDPKRKKPALLRPEQRFLIVAEDGEPLTRSGFDSAWQRLMRAASAPPEKGGIIPKEDRFGLHAMKHRGITDTKGTLKDKQTAGGHKSEAMTHLYDHSVPEVSTPETGEFSGEFSGAGPDKASGDS